MVVAGIIETEWALFCAPEGVMIAVGPIRLVELD
jgi:hypothetical protein